MWPWKMRGYLSEGAGGGGKEEGREGGRKGGGEREGQMGGRGERVGGLLTELRPCP